MSVPHRTPAGKSSVFQCLGAIRAPGSHEIQRKALVTLCLCVSFVPCAERDVSNVRGSASLDSEGPHGVFDLLGERGIVVAAQMEWGAERHADPSRPDEMPPDGEQPFDVVEADRDHRDGQP